MSLDGLRLNTIKFSEGRQNFLEVVLQEYGGEHAKAIVEIPVLCRAEHVASMLRKLADQVDEATKERSDSYLKDVTARSLSKKSGHVLARKEVIR